MFGIAARAPICSDGMRSGPGAADFLFLQAPSPPGVKLVPEAMLTSARRADSGVDGEIRLTYAELTALIEDAVKQLK
jgi:hypothetical protein